MNAVCNCPHSLKRTGTEHEKHMPLPGGEALGCLHAELPYSLLQNLHDLMVIKKRVPGGKGGDKERDGELQNKSGSPGVFNSNKYEELKAQSHDIPVFEASGHRFSGLHSGRCRRQQSLVEISDDIFLSCSCT